MALSDRHCAKCTADTPTMSEGEIRDQLGQLDGWRLSQRDGRPVIAKTFKFKGFMPGVEMVNRIAALAESEGHHPDLNLTYGALTVELTTHVAGGLTENDFILAAKIDHDVSPKS
jgi:4a-hydroxytetrahydrobiopterin dehydratase